MHTILLFGAGKSSTVLIEYLLNLCKAEDWLLLICDANKAAAEEKLNNSTFGKVISINITNDPERTELIKQADIVISLLPPEFHILIAKTCLQENKNLLTASYVDSEIEKLQDDIKAKGLLFLYECGLDPGIDHMSALKLISQIQSEGGSVTSFKSYCGGLIAPDCDNNPWHYKISWNPKNIVAAGKAGAAYKLNNQIVETTYQEIFQTANETEIPGYGKLAYYPNRDSLKYLKLYQLESAETFIRATLRHPEFIKGWGFIVASRLTNDEILINTDGLSLATFFQQHFLKNNILVPNNLNLQTQLKFLGIDDYETKLNLGNCSAAKVLQFILEKKLTLKPTDKDQIIMMHQIEYLDDASAKKSVKSTLIVEGKNSIITAMAKTVGLPLGIAAKNILSGKITSTGLCIPAHPTIYTPILNELETHGIKFEESYK